MTTSKTPDYSRLATESVGSDKWKAEERAVIMRAFELKRLTVLSRGKRKHQINVAGSGLSPESVGLEGAEFEWTVAMHVSEVLSQFDTLGLKGTSFWAGFVPNPLQGRLRAAAKVVGKSLGYAVALWNELGDEWRDLWEHFNLEAKPDKKQQRWQGFLDFYRVFQDARYAKDSYKTISELAEQTVLRICDAFAVRERRPFAENSEILHLLKLCDVSAEDLDRLKTRYTYWTGLQNSLVTSWKAFFSRREHRSDIVKNLDDFLEGNLRKVFGDILESDVMISILTYASFQGIDFEVNHHQLDAASIRIFCRPRDGVLDFHCLVSLNDQKSTELFHPFVALLHEIGHFVYGAHWMMELALADLIIERCQSSHLDVDSLRLINARRKLQKRIVRFHSAAEVGADEFVVSILLPDEKIREIYESNFDGDNLKIWFYHSEVSSALGLRSEHVYYKRFEPIVSDRAPNLTGPFKFIIRSSQLREARSNVSEDRIMHLMNGFWHEVMDVVNPAT